MAVLQLSIFKVAEHEPLIESWEGTKGRGLWGGNLWRVFNKIVSFEEYNLPLFSGMLRRLSLTF